MRRIAECEQEADGAGRDLGSNRLVQGRCNFIALRGKHHLTIGTNALAQLDAMFPVHQRGRMILEKIVHVGSGLPSDFQ